MKTKELLKRATITLDKIGSLKAGIEVCNDAIEKLGGQPEIAIRGAYGEILLDDDDIGLNRKTQANIAEYIVTKVAERRSVMADKLEGVLDAIDEVLIWEKPKTEKYPYPMKPKAFGAVSPDDVDL